VDANFALQVQCPNRWYEVPYVPLFEHIGRIEAGEEKVVNLSFDRAKCDRRR
jgi:hypothetical protein